ncbi:MAG: divalent metal cation transporter [Gemmatimonadetes bacterium]|nr:divalent metal cation transporter [Gemmatimonadota bacterium]
MASTSSPRSISSRSGAPCSTTPSSPPACRSREAWSTVVAILGTTISPYLFFWQASQEVEEEKAAGKVTEEARRGATEAQLHARRLDVGFGTFFSNLAMFFIILTTALTLHKAGITELATGAEVAKALEPLAGRFSSWLYAIGVIGTGALAIPTLAGSAAYAFAETLGWQQGMDENFRRAKPFYAVIVVSLLIGVLLDFADISPVKALYWTAVLNGVLAPFLLTAILMVAGNKAIMQGQPSSRLGMVTVGVTTVVMFGAAIAMFATG